jgi:hypothetical protein
VQTTLCDRGEPANASSLYLALLIGRSESYRLFAFQESNAPCLASSIASTVPRHRRDSRCMRPFAFGAGLSYALHQVGKRDRPNRQRSHHDGIAKKRCCRHNLWTATLCARHFLSAEYRLTSGNGSRGTRSESGEERSRYRCAMIEVVAKLSHDGVQFGHSNSASHVASRSDVSSNSKP